VWQAKVGPITRQGQGLLEPDLKPLKDGFDEFSVMCGGFSITVKPKIGAIFTDSHLAASVQPPCSLLWFQRNSLNVHTADGAPNAETHFYGLGLESNGKRYGYRIHSDGTAHWGGLE
jgi:hypothetical protein